MNKTIVLTKIKPVKNSEIVKTSLLKIPISLHKDLKKYCVDNEINLTDFILIAIKEKLEK